MHILLQEFRYAVRRLARRSSEIGVRMALGAKPAQVPGMLLRECLQGTAVGLALGLLIACISAGTMQSMLFGLQARDPITFCIALAMVVLVSVTASFLPHDGLLQFLRCKPFELSKPSSSSLFRPMPRQPLPWYLLKAY